MGKEAFDKLHLDDDIEKELADLKSSRSKLEENTNTQ
jgi:hypothetical protein